MAAVWALARARLRGRDRIGLGAEPVTPWPALLAGALATVLVANLVAAWPARMAARTRPALALRSE